MSVFQQIVDERRKTGRLQRNHVLVPLHIMDKLSIRILWTREKRERCGERKKTILTFLCGMMLIMFFACIVKGAEDVGKMLPNLFIVFLVKNIVQDIIFGLLKNRKKNFMDVAVHTY